MAGTRRTGTAPGTPALRIWARSVSFRIWARSVWTVRTDSARISATSSRPLPFEGLVRPPLTCEGLPPNALSAEVFPMALALGACRAARGHAGLGDVRELGAGERLWHGVLPVGEQQYGHALPID